MKQIIRFRYISTKVPPIITKEDLEILEKQKPVIRSYPTTNTVPPWKFDSEGNYETN